MEILTHVQCFFLPLSISVGTIPVMEGGETITVKMDSHVEGRYVSVVLPGARRMLTLCEVEVYGYRAPTGENLTS